MKAAYRKLNDGSLSSSTYHKKDGTNVRAKLKEQTRKEEREELGYNNSVEKTDIIKKSISTISNTLEILERLEYECDGERFKILLRAFSI